MLKRAREAFTRMTEDELTEMILRLGRYTLRECNRLRWRTGDSVELPGGETVDSIVSLALEKTLSGERHWNPEARPNLQEYLMDVIDSLLNHLATGKENTLFIPAAASDAIEVGRAGSQKEAEWLARVEISPEASLLRQEEEELQEQALELLWEESRNDPILVRVLEALLEGNEKADRIAAATGLNIREVYNAMKRLDRKAALVSSRIHELTNSER
jgi:hypothetical protein